MFLPRQLKYPPIKHVEAIDVQGVLVWAVLLLKGPPNVGFHVDWWRVGYSHGKEMVEHSSSDVKRKGDHLSGLTVGQANPPNKTSHNNTTEQLGKHTHVQNSAEHLKRTQMGVMFNRGPFAGYPLVGDSCPPTSTPRRPW